MSSKHQVSLINCQNLCFQVGNTSLLKDLDCHFEGGAVSVVLGKNGIEKIVELNLNEEEKEYIKTSAEGVTKTNGLLEL